MIGFIIGVIGGGYGIYKYNQSTFNNLKHKYNNSWYEVKAAKNSLINEQALFNNELIANRSLSKYANEVSSKSISEESVYDEEINSLNSANNSLYSEYNTACFYNKSICNNVSSKTDPNYSKSSASNDENVNFSSEASQNFLDPMLNNYSSLYNNGGSKVASLAALINNKYSELKSPRYVCNHSNNYNTLNNIQSYIDRCKYIIINYYAHNIKVHLQKLILDNRKALNIRNIDTNCIIYKPVKNNEYLSNMNNEIKATCPTVFHKYNLIRILRGYTYSYKAIKNKIDKINKFVLPKPNLILSKNLYKFSKAISDVFYDYKRTYIGDRGERIVHDNLANANIYSNRDVNPPYGYGNNENSSNQIDIMSINEHGIFIFEVKTLNARLLYINSKGQLVSEYNNGKIYYSNIGKQIRNHKHAVIYSLQKTLPKNIFNKIRESTIHTALVYISNNNVHTKFDWRRSIDNIKSAGIDNVYNQDNCTEFINSADGSIYKPKVVQALKDAINRRWDKKFNHYELANDYQATLNRVRTYVWHINSLYKKVNNYENRLIYMKRILNDKNWLNTKRIKLKQLKKLYHLSHWEFLNSKTNRWIHLTRKRINSIKNNPHLKKYKNLHNKYCKLFNNNKWWYDRFYK